MHPWSSRDSSHSSRRPVRPAPSGELFVGDSGRSWQVGELIEQGAEGTVFEVSAAADGTACVVKIARGPLDDDALREECDTYRALARQGLSGVFPTVFDAGWTPARRAFVVLEHAGQSLHEWGPEASLVDVLDAFVAAAEPIDRLHAAGLAGQVLVHRDIKPGNLMRRPAPDGGAEVLLIDLGVARSRRGTPSQLQSLVGTRGFAPIDQLLGRQCDPDPSWDRFALGASLYQVLCGDTPKSVTLAEASLTHAGRDLRRLSQLRDDQLTAEQSDELEALAPLPLDQLVAVGRLRYLTTDDLDRLRRKLVDRLHDRPHLVRPVTDAVIAALREVMEPDPARRAPDLAGFAAHLRAASERVRTAGAGAAPAVGAPPRVSPSPARDLRAQRPRPLPALRRPLRPPLVAAALLLMVLVAVLVAVVVAVPVAAMIAGGGPTPLPADIAPGAVIPTPSVLPARFVPAGHFTRGAVAGDRDAQPDEHAVAVRFSHPLAVMETELSQGLARSLTGDEPWLGDQIVGGRKRGPCRTWRGQDLVGDELPAVCIDFDSALRLANAASLADGLQPAYVFDAGGGVRWDREADGWRLPTEAEWEYIASAGSAHGPWAGDTAEGSPCAVANLYDQTGHAALQSRSRAAPCDDGFAGPAPVGSLQPNAWGLHDLSGNVWEWCWDSYVDQPPGGLDPVAEGDGQRRVRKSGSWASLPSMSRVSARNSAAPAVRLDNVGVRFVRNVRLEEP